MSQYPPSYPPQPPQYPYGQSPYAPPQPAMMPYAYYGTQASPSLAHAKRASVLMWVMGALCLILGACFAIAGAALPKMQTDPKVQAAFARVEAAAPGVRIPLVFIAMGVVVLVVGLAYIVIGTLVRRGGLVSSIFGIIVASFVLLFMLLNALGSAVNGEPASACIGLVIAGLNGVLITWLSQSIRATRGASLAAQQQAMYWQAQYYQQAAQQQQQPPQSPPPTGPTV